MKKMLRREPWYQSIMKIGNYIKQVTYTDRGEINYRYGIVLGMVSSRPLRAKVFFFPSPSYFSRKGSYIEIIKLELIEIISEA